MSVDARKEEYQEVELFGKPALFTNSRIERNTVPDGWFCYELRGSDYDPGRPVTIEPHVVVNHAGSILTHEPVKFRNERTSRRLRDGLNFTGDIISLADFCEDHELAYPTDTCKYMLRPASPEEAGLFYAHSLDEEKALGCIGNVRIDFGHRGQEFWHTWWPSYDTALNTPEFKAELQELVDELRTSVLKNLSGMNSYCYEHGGKIDGGYQQNYGYVAETDNYHFCLRCIPVQGDYNAYLYAYDKRQQELNMKNAEKPIIARTAYANGEVFEHTDPEAFLKELREELQYRNTTGFRYEVLTDDPALRKAVDDELYNLFGEDNPRPLEEYGLTEQGRKALRDAENPNLPHNYKWFVVENFGCDGEARHDTDSLTGAIDRFNGFACDEKRLCVTKDGVSTVYLAITHDGETHIDDGWQENPRFATDSTIDKVVARLKLSIAGLEPSGPTMTLGGM